MSAIAAILALVVQIVTLKPADLPTKPVYVRVGVGVDSRLMLPEGLVRLHGQHATAEMLGLKLGQARPRAVLLLHPRSAGVGRLMFVGPTRTLWLVVEASTLGTAQDVDLRMADAETVSEGSEPSSAAPSTAQVPKSSSVAPAAGPHQRTAAPPAAQAPRTSSVAPATEPPQRTAAPLAAQAPKTSSVAPAAGPPQRTPAPSTAQAPRTSPVAPVAEPSQRTPAPLAAQVPRTSSVAPAAGPHQRMAATARPTPPRADGYPAPPTPRPSPSPRRQATAAKPGFDGVPTPAPPRHARPATVTPTPALVGAPTPPASTADEATTLPAPAAEAEPATATATAAAIEQTPEPTPITRRLMRRVGRPGERGVVLEELRRDGARLTLRARIEGALGAQLVQLDVAGVPTALNVEPAGHDLVVVGTVSDAAQIQLATLIVSHAGRWHTTKLRFPRGGTV